jgi:hypothetical protein
MIALAPVARMTALPFDTPEHAPRLEDAGFSPKQAGGTTDAPADAMSGAEPATKSDRASVRTELKQEVGNEDARQWRAIFQDFAYVVVLPKVGLTEALSVAAADRRIDRTVQITFSVGVAFPCDALAATRQITDGIAFDIGAARACQLDDDTYGLVGLLDACLHFADVFLVGGDDISAYLLSEAGIGDRKASKNCQSQTADAHFQNLRSDQSHPHHDRRMGTLAFRGCQR